MSLLLVFLFNLVVNTVRGDWKFVYEFQNRLHDRPVSEPKLKAFLDLC